ncbi:hypothetical protein [Croceicoccus sp. Ery15]|uniref:hypothetical protein n=1 Tax=Croceicoccus sp. Ery15 TaxID=1703338 RepID=UPI001E42E48E|nr:hypothetical protein [Croceicoccus sp. Ery15]
MKRALGFTGGEGNTVAESSALYDPYLPKAGDRDAQIERKIAALRGLAADSRKKSVTTLGGVPDANGNIVPVPEGQDPSVWAQNYIAGNTGPSAAPAGSDVRNEPIDPQYQGGIQRISRPVGGQPDPEAYVAKRVELDRKYGYQPDEQSYRDWAVGAAGAIQQGGATIPSQIPGVNVDMSRVDQLRNNIANNPVSAAGIGAVDAATLGIPSLLQGEQIGMIGEENPLSMLAGQVAGSIVGTQGSRRAWTERGRPYRPQPVGRQRQGAVRTQPCDRCDLFGHLWQQYGRRSADQCCAGHDRFCWRSGACQGC